MQSSHRVIGSSQEDDMTLEVIIHAEEGGYWAEVPAMPGCATQGETLPELLTNLDDAIRGCLSADEEISRA